MKTQTAQIKIGSLVVWHAPWGNVNAVVKQFNLDHTTAQIKIIKPEKGDLSNAIVYLTSLTLRHAE